jgi:predicted ATPase
MIKSISISNFKCFKNKISVNISDLTLISGLNNSGKSTIYQMLLLLKQSTTEYIKKIDKYSPNLKLNGHILQLGNPNEIINQLENELVFEIDFYEPIKIKIAYKLNATNISDHEENSKSFLTLSEANIEYSDSFLLFKRTNDKYFIKAHISLSFDNSDLQDYFFSYLKEKCHQKNIADSYTEFLANTVEFDDIENIDFLDFIIMGFEVNLSYISRCVNEKYRPIFSIEEFRNYLIEKDFLEDSFRIRSSLPINFFQLLKNFTNRIYFILPYKGDPKRIYVETEYKNPLLVPTRNMGKKISYRFDENKKSIMVETVENALKYWISKIVIDIDSFKVNAIVEGLISETLIRENGKYIPISHVGFGISQILPLISTVLMTAEKSICIIDEPEAHLHPSLQSRLADFFIEMIKIDKKIIIETHSDYIVNRVLYYKMLEQDLDIEMLWVLKKGFESKIEPMKCDDLGYIINKPKGFLDENDIIIQALSEERSKRL